RDRDDEPGPCHIGLLRRCRAGVPGLLALRLLQQPRNPGPAPQGGAGSLNSRPPLITTCTCCSSEMSSSGSPYTAIRSPNLPGSMVPTSSDQPMYWAAVDVADRMAFIGDMPRATMTGNCRALSPCG